MMSFARSWKLKVTSWAAPEGCRPLKLSTYWQAAEQLRVMGVHGPGHLRHGSWWVRTAVGRGIIPVNAVSISTPMTQSCQ